MTINESFYELIRRIQPLDSEMNAGINHLATIKTRLETVFDLVDCRKTGSFARGTSIRGFSDTDLFAVFRKSNFTRADYLVRSDTALENVRQALMARYPNTPVSRDSMAVVISFSDGQSVDVVPALFERMEQKWPVYLIPDEAGGWMQTCPGLYDAYIAQCNKQAGGKLNYVAQVMKFWRECRTPRIPLSSFHIEIVLAYEEVSKGVQPYSACILEILRSLARRECRAIRDPYQIAGNIPAVKSSSQRERSLASVTNSRNHADSAIYAEQSGDLNEARRQWDLVFNGKFPW